MSDSEDKILREDMLTSCDFTFLPPVYGQLEKWIIQEPPWVRVVVPEDTIALDGKVDCLFHFLNQDNVCDTDILAISRVNSDDMYSNFITCNKRSQMKGVDCITFEYPCLPTEPGQYEVCFIRGDYILGKSKPITFVDSDPIMMYDKEFIEVEDPHDPGLVVFKSRNSLGESQLRRSLGPHSPPKSLDLEGTSASMPRSLKQEGISCEKKIPKKEDVGKLVTFVETSKLPPFAKALDDALTPDGFMHSGENSSSIIEENYTKDLPDLQDPEDLVDSLTPKIQCLFITDDPNPVNVSQVLGADLKRVMSELNEVRTVFSEIMKSCQSLPQTLEEVKDSLKASKIESQEKEFTTTGYDLGTCQSEPNNPDSENPPCSVTPESYQNLLAENTQLLEEQGNLKESIAFLKSRIAVLELELHAINQKRYTCLVDSLTQRIDAYEHENSALKAQLDKSIKMQCEMESLKAKCESFNEENEGLKKLIKAHCSTSTSKSSNSSAEHYKEKCLLLEKEVSDLKKVISERTAINERKESNVVRNIIKSQGTEMAFMRSECQGVGAELDSLLSAFTGQNYPMIDSVEIIRSLTELRNRCQRVVKRDPENIRMINNSLDQNQLQTLTCQIGGLEAELEKTQKNNLELKEQLITLRKQTVGKVSILNLPN